MSDLLVSALRASNKWMRLSALKQYLSEHFGDMNEADLIVFRVIFGKYYVGYNNDNIKPDGCDIQSVYMSGVDKPLTFVITFNNDTKIVCKPDSFIADADIANMRKAFISTMRIYLDGTVATTNLVITNLDKLIAEWMEKTKTCPVYTYDYTRNRYVLAENAYSWAMFVEKKINSKCYSVGANNISDNIIYAAPYRPTY